MSLTFADFEIQKLSELDPADVQVILQRIRTQLQELNPTLDLQRGVFHDQLLYHRAVLETALRQTLERYQSARSLQQIEANPELADPGVVDEVLSNWGVRRKIGTKAVGSVAIELSANRSVVISAGAIFEADGLRYVSQKTYISRTLAEQVVVDTDRLMTPLSNGNWLFVIEVEADDVGPDYMIPAGRLIVPDRPVTNYVTSYAASSFTDGTGTETNSELLNRLQYGLAAKTLSNRSTMQAYILSLEQFQAVTHQSIVGFGDAEMLRDKHTIMPISFGGRVDWYIRSQTKLNHTSAKIAAVCTAVNDADSTWQFSLARDAYPGFYEIKNIRREVDSQLNSGFEIVSDTRGTDLTKLDTIPDIANVTEGVYTAYQTATIQFKDTVTPLGTIAVGQSAYYVCDVVGLPSIAALQNEVSAASYRHCASDIVIKAPVPCFVSVSFVINKAAADTVPDVAAIKAAVADLINGVDFIGRVDGSRVVETVHAFIRNSASVTQLELLGRIRRPDGVTEYVRSTDALLVPYRPDKMVSEKTVQFFCDPTDVAVAVVTNLPVPA